MTNGRADGMCSNMDVPPLSECLVFFHLQLLLYGTRGRGKSFLFSTGFPSARYLSISGGMWYNAGKSQKEPCMKAFLRKLMDPSLFRFLIVGVINTLVGSAIMFGLYNLAGWGYWPSSAANYILTSILSFFLNKYFTFQSRSWSGGEVLRFAANIAVCYALAYGAAKPLVRLLLSGASAAVRDNVSMLAGMVLFTACNYLGQRFFAFKKS